MCCYQPTLVAGPLATAPASAGFAFLLGLFFSGLSSPGRGRDLSKENAVASFDFVLRLDDVLLGDDGGDHRVEKGLNT